MVRDNRHDSAYIFGAICPARAVGAAVLMPTANTEAMNEHLKEISTQVSPGAHAVLVCDGAGWHQRGKQLVVPDNISLLSLPPYSPELNPMENVWDYLRQNKLCAQVWDTYDDILEACKTAWNWLIADPDRNPLHRDQAVGLCQRLSGLVLNGEMADRYSLRPIAAAE
jgi:putative transposase